MTRFTLMPHPDFPPLAVTGVTAEVACAGSDILLVYRVDGVAKLVVPAASNPERTDGLWKTTCFEIFLKAAGGAGYAEFNFSPSGRWAAYAFEGYRAEMRDLAMVSPAVGWNDDGLSASFRHPGLVPGSTRSRALTPVSQADRWTPEQVRGDGVEWPMAVTAVIEEEGGTKSYWALAHPDGPPDFHHPACFAATLPAPDAA